MTLKALRVRDWSQNFENNRTREMRTMAWVPVPIKLDGDGYAELLDHPDGAAHFGAWIALLEVAAKCEERGTFLRDIHSGRSRPHDLSALSRVTRIPAVTLSAAIERLLAIGWLEEFSFVSNGLQEGAEIPQGGAGCLREVRGNPAGRCGMPAPRASRAEQNRTEQNYTEQKEKERGVAREPESGSAPPAADESKRGSKSKNAKKPAPKFPDIDTLVRFLERYPELDTEPVREALRGWLLVAQDEGNAVSAAYMAEQLKKCAAWGPERAAAAMKNSADKRLKFIGEPFSNRNGGTNPTGLPMHEPGLTADQKRRRIGAPADWREQMAKRMEDVIPWDPRTGKFIEDPNP